MSQIHYTPAFTEKVKGQLRAQFRLDAQGVPLFRIVENRLREYTINLSLSAPTTAPEIESVTYVMDDPTFWDPVARSDDRDNDFTVQISSYGDVLVKVAVRIKGRTIKQEAWLSNLLQAGHAGDNSPAIQAAITDIQAN